MTRRRAVGAAFVLLIATLLALGIWRSGGGGDTRSGAQGGARSASTAARPARIDPRTQDRASIAGVVTSSGAPVASARVCAFGHGRDLPAKLMREPRCVSTDTRGAYVIADLLAATYHVSAGAPRYRPTYSPTFDVASGEQRTGVDLVLRDGAVEVTGTVSDITGGPIARTLVGADGAPLFETDDAGRFSIWVAPGDCHLFAIADGYLRGRADVAAPGHAAIVLTPASSLSGVVVDGATGAPVAGVGVAATRLDHGDWDGPDDLTDDDGRFRIEPLSAERYIVMAQAPNRYGEADGSVMVGFAQHVEGIVVKVFPAARLEGRVVEASTRVPCKKPRLWLYPRGTVEAIDARSSADGRVVIDALRPGEYEVNLGCESLVHKEEAPLEVGATDLTGLTWELPAGGTVRGRVLDPHGKPVADAAVEMFGYARDTTGPDGRYELVGLGAGPIELTVSSDAGATPAEGFDLELGAGAVVERDLVLEPAGRIMGIVVDTRGRPVAGIHVEMKLDSSSESWAGRAITGADGSFAHRPLPSGTYLVSARSSNRVEPVSTTVTLRAPGVVTAKLVVEAPDGSIRGTVVDAAGAPIDDAYVVAALEEGGWSGASRTRWTWDEGDVVTDLDGAFVVRGLPAGSYSLRAYRRGGGEGVAEHVPVGGTARIQIQATGVIEGTVRQASGVSTELHIVVRDPATELSRLERFHRTDGRYAIRDLPAGTYSVTAQVGQRRGYRRVSLAAGARVVADLDLDAPTATIRGRVIDLVTAQPVGGMTISTMTDHSVYDLPRVGFVEPTATTAPDGRFELTGVPTTSGPVPVTGSIRDRYQGYWRAPVREGTTTLDLGDVGVVPERDYDTAGVLGIRWTDDPDTWEVAELAPASPAARSTLAAGDVVVSVDGIDVTGHNHGAGFWLMLGPPGTRVTLGLARAESVTLTRAPRKPHSTP